MLQFVRQTGRSFKICAVTFYFGPQNWHFIDQQERAQIESILPTAQLSTFLAFLFGLVTLVLAYRLHRQRKGAEEAHEELKNQLTQQADVLEKKEQSFKLESEARMLAESALRNSEESYRRLIENAPLCILETNLKQEVIGLNEAGLSLMGYARQEIIGIDLLSIFARDCRLQVEEAWTAAHIEASDEFTFQTIRRPNRIFKAFFVPVQNPQGEVVRILCMGRDITEHQLAEEDLRFRAMLLSKISEAVISTTTDHVITSWNHAAELIYGWKEYEVLGRPSKDVFRSAIDDDQREAIYTRLRRSGVWEGEMVQHDRHGSPLQSKVKLNLVYDANGVPTGILGINRDVTDLKRTTEELQKRNQEMEAMLRVSQKLSERRDLDVYFEHLLEAAHTTLPLAEEVTLWFCEQPCEPFQLRARHGSLGVSKEQLATRINTQIAPWLERYDAPLSVTFLMRVAGQEQPVDCNFLVACFRNREGIKGLLVACVRFSEGSFNTRHGELLSAVSSQALVGIENVLMVDQIRKISIRLLEAQEVERRRIAQELHDEVGGFLTGLQYSLKTLPMAQDSLEAEVDHSLKLITDLISQVRLMSLRLRPHILDELGLYPTLQWLVDRFAAQTKIDISLHTRIPEDKRYASELENAGYRIVQEALTNAARHADAAHIQILIHETEASLVVSIIDDGKGFEIPEKRATLSMGLAGMQERSELLGGSLLISSEPGVGTSISATLPLHKEDAVVIS